MEFHLFTRLPLELREKVYEHIILDNPITYNKQPLPLKQSVAEYRNGALVNVTHSSPNASDPSMPHKYGIAFANHAVSLEFLNFVYLKAIFNFPMVSRCISSWRQWPISVQVLERLRHIRLVRDCRDEADCVVATMFDREVGFEMLTRSCPLVRTVEVELLLSKRSLKAQEVKNCTKWPWSDTHKGSMTTDNVWLVPRHDWCATWIV